jgi:tripartite-type tricarboxylate transporter receptor subunit TctC
MSRTGSILNFEDDVHLAGQHVAPAGTPDAIVARLNTAINDALKSPDIRATLSKFGSEPLGGTPQEFAGFVASESKKWSEIIRLSGVKVD